MRRLTVVEHVYHQAPGVEATTTDSAFARNLSTDEQPYSRTCKVGTEWQPLDCGWLKESSMLTLKNEGTSLLLIGQQTTHAACLTDDVAAFARLRAGESCRFLPENQGGLRICAVKHEGRMTLTLFPE